MKKITISLMIDRIELRHLSNYNNWLCIHLNRVQIYKELATTIAKEVVHFPLRDQFMSLKLRKPYLPDEQITH